MLPAGLEKRKNRMQFRLRNKSRRLSERSCLRNVIYHKNKGVIKTEGCRVVYMFIPGTEETIPQSIATLLSVS